MAGEYTQEDEHEGKPCEATSAPAHTYPVPSSPGWVLSLLRDGAVCLLACHPAPSAAWGLQPSTSFSVEVPTRVVQCTVW